MVFSAQSCPKPQNDVYANGNIRTNEDTFVVEMHQNTVFAVSDGAGGSGIFARDWANTLLKNLPDKPFADIKALNEWIESFWEKFYLEKKQEIEHNTAQNLVDFVKIKFNEEGSFATLLAVWITENHIKTVAFGDSTLVVYYPNTKKCVFFPYTDVLDYENNPFLLNWHETANEKGFFAHTFDIDTNFHTPLHLYLVTDALAQYLHCAYLATHFPDKLLEIAHKPCRLADIAQKFLNLLEIQHTDIDFFASTLQHLKESLASPLLFKNFIYDLHQKGLLLRDDCTCIAIG